MSKPLLNYLEPVLPQDILTEAVPVRYYTEGSALNLARAALFGVTPSRVESIIDFLRAYKGDGNGNSLIIGGPLSWGWQASLDASHHGSLEGPANAHRHLDLAGIGIDDHHARDHAPRHGLGEADAVSLDAAQIGTGVFGVARGGTGLSTIAKGGILYASALDTLSRIAPTAANQVLRSTAANALQIAALVAADIPSLLRSKITDFFGSPFWGSIPDKPSTFPPSAHKTSHQNGGTDKINVGGLSGLLADDQHVRDAEVVAVALALAGGTMTGNDILRSEYTNFLSLCGGAAAFAGGGCDLFGGEAAGSPGYCRLNIGDRRAGKAPDSHFDIYYRTNETDTKIWDVDKTGELGTGIIPAARLKTATGSATGSLAATTQLMIDMNDYCFFPGIQSTNNFEVYSRTMAISESYIGRLAIYNAWGVARDYGVYWRYVTSSGEPEIWLGLDKDGKIIAIWEAEDPPPSSPPIESEQIVSLIKLNPSLEEFKAMREEGRLGLMILEEGTITDNKLTFRGFSFDVEIRNKEDVPRTKRVKKTVTRMVKDSIPVMIPARVFDELAGVWEDRPVQKAKLVSQTRYRLVSPELGEESEVESYRVIVEQSIYELKDVPIEEEIEVEELIVP